MSLRALEPGLEALRDRAVLSFDAARVSRVRFEVDGPAIEVVRTAAGPGGEAWAVTTPRAAPVRPYRIPALLRALAGLEATRVAGEGAAAVAAHGLDRPRRTVTLLAEDGTTVVRLEVGAEDAGRAFVRAGGTDRVLEVPRAALAVLPAGPEELEDRPAPGGRPGQGG